MISAIIVISGNEPDAAINFYELMKCIEDQDCNDYEVIVVEQYDHNTLLHGGVETNIPVKYRAIKGKPFNVSWCRNVGARMASGDILLFLDSDVVFGKEYFSKVSEDFKSEYSIGWDNSIWLSKKGREVYLQNRVYKTDWDPELCDVSTLAPGLATVFSRDFYLDRISGYNENLSNREDAERDIVIRARALTVVWNIPYTLIHLYNEVKEPYGEQNALELPAKYPLQISKRLSGSKLGNFEHPTPINLHGLESRRDLLSGKDTSVFTDVIPYLRQMIHFLKRVFQNRPVTGAEVGVYEGQNALSILRTLNIEKLYLIDPYIPYNEYYEPKNNAPELNKARETATLRLRNYSDVIEWMYLRSDEAASKIEDDLDFVYIDGNHAYDYVKRDINDYYRLVKPSGYIGGHDYALSYNPAVIEVKRAVDDFVNEYGYDLTIGSFSFPDWWVQK